MRIIGLAAVVWYLGLITVMHRVLTPLPLAPARTAPSTMLAGR